VSYAFANNSSAESDAKHSGVTSYDATYFNQYFPLTARDMVRWLPDSVASGRSRSGRGLGANEDRILINGKRVTGKSFSTNDRLERISADRVLRIDVIRQ
jgi:hypothetical protein